MDNEHFVEEVKKQVEDYVKLRYELVKLDLGEKAAKVSASLFSTLIIVFISTLTVLFISLVAGFYFSGVFNDFFKGFGLIAAFYLLLLIILLACRKQWIERPMVNKIIRNIFNDNE